MAASRTSDLDRLMIPSGWDIALCQPEKAPGPGCQPTVLSRAVYAARRAYVRTDYCGACFGCGQLSPIRYDENEAAEDAHDHTHPGWREQPVLDPLPYIEPLSEAKRRERVARELTHLFPNGWAERCGPTITWRTPPCTLHVPGGGIFGGYDMGRVRPGATSLPATERVKEPLSSQLDLFDQHG